LEVGVVSVTRSFNLVTVVLSNGIVNPGGTLYMELEGITDSTLDGLWPVTQPDPADNATFTFDSVGSDSVSFRGTANIQYRIVDAVHTENDYTLVMDDSNRVYRFSSAPLINTDAPDQNATINLAPVSS